MTDWEFSSEMAQEHREIDRRIEDFIDGLDSGYVQRAILVETLEMLRRHIYIEEVFVFPPLRAGGAVMPIFVMMREHGQLWHTMDALVDLLDRGKSPAARRNICLQLLDRLHRHNSKEETIIYPTAETALPRHLGTEIDRFAEHGQVPAGWVCQHARQWIIRT